MKNNLRRKSWLCAAAMMGVSMLAVPPISVFAEEVIETEDVLYIEMFEAETSEAETYTAKKGWAYKVIDGHLYKRLYNYSTGRWETDWILVQ